MTLVDEAVRHLARRQGELKHRALDAHDKPEDPLRLVEVRNRYDEAYRSLGARGAPQPIGSESAYTYRRRLSTGLQPHSPTSRDSNLYDLADEILNAAEPQILAEVRAAVADHSRPNADGSLRVIQRTDAAGHGITEFAGNPLSWMSTFMHGGRSVRRFQTPNGVPIRIQRRSL